MKLKIHDLLCKELCGCGKVCYSHPDMPTKEHKCKDCLVKDEEIIEENLGFIEGLKSLFKNCKLIIAWFWNRRRWNH